MTAQELADALNGTVSGDASCIITGLAEIQHAQVRQAAFLANKKYERFLETTSASVVLVDRTTITKRQDLTLIHTEDPYLAFVKAIHLFHPQQARTPGIHPKATVDETALIADDVCIDAGAVIGPKAAIGARCVIGAGAVIGEGVKIGDDCLIHPNVTIIAQATLGNRVIIHSGTTIGSDGFGFAPSGNEYVKVPQVGSVVIEDDVEIGANCAIDRATLGHTFIGKGSKIDNLIQIAHNVHIGENSVIAAQSGVSGSTIIGKHVILAGQVGVVGHVEIADNVTVGAQSGVSKSISESGKVFRGSPAREIHEELRQEAALRRLPDLINDMRNLERELQELKAALAPANSGSKQ